MAAAVAELKDDERDCIIFSLGYAYGEDGKLNRNFGWLNQQGGENRLNVAISRAHKIYIATSIPADQPGTDDLDSVGLKLLAKYLRYASAISRGDRCAAEQVLLSMSAADAAADTASDASSDLIAEIQTALENLGYTVHRSVGMGGYQIDLAICSEDGYELGICDTRLYAASPSVRERDVYRQKFFTSHGCKLHRIWSADWWRDKVGELAKIAAKAPLKHREEENDENGDSALFDAE